MSINKSPRRAARIARANSNSIDLPHKVQAALSHQTLLPESVTNPLYLALRGPCIVIHSYNKSQQDALLLHFILIKKSTCFVQSLVSSWLLYRQST